MSSAPDRNPSPEVLNADGHHTPELLKRLKNQPGVRGVVVATRSGKPIHSTLSDHEAKVAAQTGAATFEAVAKTMEPLDDSGPVFLRIRTKQHSYLMAEEDDFILVCQEEL